MSCFNIAVFQSYASTPSITPDDDVFRHLSLTYSRNHPTMHLGQACKQGTPSFKNGITNGAAWYPLTGGMQDFNYVWYGCMEVTLELSCCKYPAASELPKFWDENRLFRLKPGTAIDGSNCLRKGIPQPTSHFMAGLIKHCSPDKHKALGFVRPGAGSKQVIEMCNNLEELHKEDTLVLLCGSNDVAKNESQVVINGVSDILRRVNGTCKIVLIDLPTRYDLVEWNYVAKSKFSFSRASKAERTLHTRHGMHFNLRGKKWLSKQIIKAVEDFELKFIPMDNSSPALKSQKDIECISLENFLSSKIHSSVEPKTALRTEPNVIRNLQLNTGPGSGGLGTTSSESSFLNSFPLSFLFLNIQGGLLAKLNALESVIMNNNCDIICLSEHWLSSSEINACSIKHFNLVSIYQRKVNNYGGTLIYASNRLKCNVDVLSSCVDYHFEACFIA
ncbi:hypothetical protein J6590_096285 [Homalodisca vitripennis]|nr:hypothetical protein J6590_096285 [Homalodisca vitripennis]